MSGCTVDFHLPSLWKPHPSETPYQTITKNRVTVVPVALKSKWNIHLKPLNLCVWFAAYTYKSDCVCVRVCECVFIRVKCLSCLPGLSSFLIFKMFYVIMPKGCKKKSALGLLHGSRYNTETFIFNVVHGHVKINKIKHPWCTVICRK